MGKRPFLFIIVFCLLWLAACEQAAPESLPTVTAVPPQPTATEPNPPTALPSATMGWKRPLLRPPTPTIDAESIETLSSLSSQLEGKEFQLRTPVPDILMQILATTLAKQKSDKESPVSMQSDVLEAEIASLFNLIERDIKRFHPQGFLTAINLKTHPFEWDFEYQKTLWAVWQEYALFALNENQIDLANQTEIETPLAKLAILKTIQKDGSNSTWLLLINPQLDPETSWSFFLPITKNTDGRYYLLPNDLKNPYDPDSINISSHVDVTGDGQQDVVIEIGGVFPRRLEVYSWDNSVLSLLAEIDAEDGKYTASPQIEFDDFNEDGVADIRITHQKWMDLGCRYEEVELYSWRGTEPHYSQTSNIEDKPECDAARAITQNLSSQSIYIGDVILSPENLSVDERITMLNRSLANTTVETAPFVDYIALLRLHLAMAYQSKGENELALATMASINELPVTEFVIAMQDIFLITEEDLVSTCRLMYQDEWFRSLDMNANGDLLAQLGMLRNYGYPTTALQRRMCPFPMVITGLLERLSLPVSLSPEAAFAANHIEILFQHEFNIDEDPENEWLIIVSPAAPQVVVLDAVGDTWQLYRLAELIPPITDIQVQTITETFDGNPVILVQATQNIHSWFCWGDQQTDIFAIELSEGVYDLVDHTTACADDSLPIHSDNLDNNFYESPVDFFYNQQINQIEETILSGERPFLDLQNELNDLIDKLPYDTPSRQMMHNRLLYLSGLTYELSDDDQAVATYLDLIQQAPNSLWSWLAWARLEPVE